MGLEGAGVGLEGAGRGGRSLYFSRLPVTDAIHTQRLLGWVPALWQRGHLLTPPL